MSQDVAAPGDQGGDGHEGGAAPRAVEFAVAFGNHCSIPTGNAPLGTAANPFTDTAYVVNAGDNTVSVINGRTDHVTATVPVGAAPHDVAIDPMTAASGNCSWRIITTRRASSSWAVS